MASQTASALIQGTRNRDMTFNAGTGTALAVNAISTPAAFFLLLPLFHMNKVMMEIAPQLHLHLGDLSSFGCY